jgi:hypothetical protein
MQRALTVCIGDQRKNHPQSHGPEQAQGRRFSLHGRYRVCLVCGRQQQPAIGYQQHEECKERTMPKKAQLGEQLAGCALDTTHHTPSSAQWLSPPALSSRRQLWQPVKSESRFRRKSVAAIDQPPSTFFCAVAAAFSCAIFAAAASAACNETRHSLLVQINLKNRRQRNLFLGSSNLILGNPSGDGFHNRFDLKLGHVHDLKSLFGQINGHFFQAVYG